MPSPRNACRSSPASWLYWGVASLVAWIALSAIGLVWYPLHASSASTILFAMAAGCFANWIHNRSCHCYFSGPVLFLGAAAFLLRQLGALQFPSWIVWVAVCIGVCFSFSREFQLR